jgi:hypothetical protein
MENANQALLMAGGTLIGVILITALVFFAKTLNVFPSELDKEEVTEQIQAFNAEYEAYNKKIMYGADLISVLNKAKSNNEKYVKGNFLDGQTYTDEYVINIKFTLKTALQDRIIVRYLSSSSTTNTSNTVAIGKEIEYTDGNGPSVTLSSAGFKEPSKEYLIVEEPEKPVNSNINLTSTKLITGTYISNFTAGQYSLCDVEGKPDIAKNVNALLNSVSAITQTIENTTTDVNKKLKGVGWSTAEWRTALYDLKTRKFKCETVSYNEDTGRIEEMVFKEY